MISARGWLVVAAACAAFLLVGTHAKGQHFHPPQDAELHERFYSTWMRPDKPSVSCCNLEDCYPTEARFHNGTWFAKRREDGKWLAVPPAKIEHNRDSPDGRNHLCAPKPAYEASYENGVICFKAGGGT